MYQTSTNILSQSFPIKAFPTPFMPRCLYLVLFPLNSILQFVQLVLQLGDDMCFSLHLLQLGLPLALQQGTLHLCLEDNSRPSNTCESELFSWYWLMLWKIYPLHCKFSWHCKWCQVIFYVRPYLLFWLPELLVQLSQPGLELIDTSEYTNPLLLQVTQLQTTCTAWTGVLMLQWEREQ